MPMSTIWLNPGGCGQIGMLAGLDSVAALVERIPDWVVRLTARWWRFAQGLRVCPGLASLARLRAISARAMAAALDSATLSSARISGDIPAPSVPLPACSTMRSMRPCSSLLASALRESESHPRPLGQLGARH